MRPVTLLIKPASSVCNLRCKYCFYHSIAEKRDVASFGIMKDEVLETLVKRVFDYASGFATFGFQGGEPTLAGLDFFEKLIELQRKYNTRKIKVYNTIQTNGTTMDSRWAHFLAKNDFLVGISIDGTPNIHDRFRVDAAGNGTLKKVMETIRIFEKYDVKYNALCVVNNVVAQHANQVYTFFKRNKIQYLQFIPCLNPFGDESVNYDFSLSNERFFSFLKITFDKWSQDLESKTPVSIRTFDNYVGMIAGYPAESCGLSGECSCYFLIESDGSAYPCDFYVFEKYKMGNISENTLEEMINGPIAANFIAESKYVHPKCKDCKWYQICRGGCKRNREPFVDGKPGLNNFCEAYYRFFEYAYPRLKEISKKYLKPNVR